MPTPQLASQHRLFRRQSAPTERATKRRKLLLAAVLIAFVLSAGGLAWHAHQSQSGLSSLTRVERQISRHYLLPTNEVPVLATVTDQTKINTPFLQQAKNGDKILLYQKNQVAIIYRPAIDRVVAVGPVTIDNPPAAASQ